MGSHIEFERTFQAACYNKVDFSSLYINPEIDFKAVLERVDQKISLSPNHGGRHFEAFHISEYSSHLSHV